MIASPWGKCSRCGKPLGSIIQRGLCNPCESRRSLMKKLDERATPEKLVENPYLAEIDAMLNGWFSL